MSDAPILQIPYRVLTLDGGGAKGFYTLGVLMEIEAMLGCPLHQRFDLIFGTSTGAIIATLLALGHSVDEVHRIYRDYVPAVLSRWTPSGRTSALSALASSVYGDKTFRDVKTGVGVVTARWNSERPMVFKSDIRQAHGSRGSFVPGFGVSIAKAVQASCSAFPFFERTTVTTSDGDQIELVDGGYCANNPTLYALADATAALNLDTSAIRIVSVGVGAYPQPHRPLMWLIKRIPFNSIELLQKTLEINTQSMDQLRSLLFGSITTIRISDTFTHPELATDLLEHDLRKLNLLRQRGRESFASREPALRAALVDG